MKSPKKEPKGRPFSDPGKENEWIVSLKRAKAEYDKQGVETRWGAIHVEEKGPIPGKRTYRHWKPRCPAGKLRKGEILILEYYDGTAAPKDGWHTHEWASAIMNHPVVLRLWEKEEQQGMDQNIVLKARNEAEPLKDLLEDLRSRQRKISKLLKDRPGESLKIHGIRFKDSCAQITLALENYGDLAMLIRGAYEAGFRHALIEIAPTKDDIEERRVGRTVRLNASKDVPKKIYTQRSLGPISALLMELFSHFNRREGRTLTNEDLLKKMNGYTPEGMIDRIEVDKESELITFPFDVSPEPLKFKNFTTRMTTVRKRCREKVRKS